MTARKWFQVFVVMLLGSSAWASEMRLEFLTGGLTSPLYLTHAGDGSGRLFIVERGGRIRIHDGQELLETPFLDIRERVEAGGEMGLLGLAFHPDYETNGRFFVNYTRFQSGQLQTVIAEYQVSQINPDVANAEERVLLTYDQPFQNHNGGWLGFGPDGYLYIASGDGGSAGDPLGNGQNVNTLLGAILRIDVDSGSPYGIPPDNPFLGQTGADEIYAYGLRNPWRASFDRNSGRFLAADVGQNRFEEIDIIESGGNYGWNILEGDACYPFGDSCEASGLIPPIDTYGRDQGHSVTGGYVYRGPQSSEHQGDYVFGDFVLGNIWTLREVSPGTWERTFQLKVEGNILASFGEDEEGNLYLVNLGGAVDRILFGTDPPQGDLVLTKTLKSGLFPGQKALYELHVINQGDAPSETPVTILDPLPAPLTFYSAQSPDWACVASGNELDCERNTPVASGEESTIELVVLVGPGQGVVSNTATLTVAGDADESNNSATASGPLVALESLPLTYSQLALGGGFDLTLLVSNRSQNAWQGVAELREGNDIPWSGPWSLNGADSEGEFQFPVLLEPHASERFVLRGDSLARSGYLRISPEIGISSTDLAVSFFYQLSSQGILTDSTGTSRGLPGRVFEFPVERNGQSSNTGFAWAPLGAVESFPVQLQLFDSSGTLVENRILNFEGHEEFLLDEILTLPETNFTGLLVIDSPELVHLTVLRLDAGESLQLTAVQPRVRPD